MKFWRKSVYCSKTRMRPRQDHLPGFQQATLVRVQRWRKLQTFPEIRQRWLLCRFRRSHQFGGCGHWNAEFLHQIGYLPERYPTFVLLNDSFVECVHLNKFIQIFQEWKNRRVEWKCWKYSDFDHWPYPSRRWWSQWQCVFRINQLRDSLPPTHLALVPVSHRCNQR